MGLIQVPAGVFSAAIPTGISATAVQDVFFIEAHATKSIVILGCTITQVTDAGDAQAEMLPIHIFRRTTTGSAGTTVTGKAHAPSAAAVAAVTRNRTTVGTEGDEIGSEGWNVQGGFFYKPIPEERILLTPGGTVDLGFYLEAAPASAFDIRGHLIWAEVG